MASKYVLFFFTICTLSPGETANILGLFPVQIKSHYVVFESLLKGLAEKGHNIDVVTQFPSKEVPLGYNQLIVNLADSLPDYFNNISIHLIENINKQMVQAMARLVGVDLCAAVLKTEVLQKLKKTQKKYDLVVTEIFGSDCLLGFGYLFKVPIISVSSSAILPWGNGRIGNPDNPAYIPIYFSSLTNKMSLFERMVNTFLLIRSKYLYYLHSVKDSDKIAKKFFGSDIPDLEELVLNTSLILVNSHFSIFQARPAVPNFIEVGGIHISEPKPLTKYFEDLVTTDKDVIYLCMGSMIISEFFDSKKLQGMFDAFAQLPNKILWKGSREKIPKELKIPKNIHFEEWMPQIDILCHPNVKLFISHGGLLSLQEALYCNIPVLGIPFFADQNHNIVAFVKMGIAVKVVYKDISKETILEAVEKLLKIPSYKQNSERISKQFKDRPMSPLDTAVYWVEYVIRHNGAPQLRSAGADLSWYQYYLVDVSAIIIISVLLILYSVNVLFKFILKTLCGGKKQKHD